MKESIVKAFDESIRVKQAFLRDNLEALTQAIDAIVAAFKRGNKLLLFGNGGSAADAQHIAAEFTNRFLIERPPLPALALTTDTSALTAIANDYDYAQVFAKQVQALGKAGRHRDCHFYERQFAQRACRHRSVQKIEYLDHRPHRRQRWQNDR